VPSTPAVTSLGRTGESEALRAAVEELKPSTPQMDQSPVPLFPALEEVEVASNSVLPPADDDLHQIAALRQGNKTRSAPDEFSTVPRFYQLPRDFRNELPEIVVSVHIYDPNPKRRSVRINRRKVSEGQEVEEGLLLEAVRAEGIVMSFEGTRFWLDRP
jgi:general secretion pathway protein B